jgi:lipopolysaccharide/colanic/teichoic acid biosynthesis glycosyltransferase
LKRFMQGIEIMTKVSLISESQVRLSPWNFSLRKRMFDVIVSVVALTIMSPVMAVIAAAIKLSTPGAVLFRQRRVGKNGKLFEILKFRTMVTRAEATGLGITRRGDARITPLGSFLRRWKLDELPQLFNVLRGDMSLVGPRPDLPEYCESLVPEQRVVFSLLPGVTGWATLQFRDEEELLASVPEEQLASYYVKSLFPEKTRLAVEYAKSATFLSDLKIVLRTSIGR